MKLTPVGCAIAAAILLAGCSSAPQDTSPRFTHMDLRFHTQEHGKDEATPVTITVVADNDSAPGASLKVEGQRFNPYSTSTVIVRASGDGFPLDELKRERILVAMAGSGGHFWDYEFDAILHFSDGSEALVSSGSQSLSPGGAGNEVPLSLASVASASAVGRMEKFAFGLLSGGLKSTSDEESDATASGTAAASQAEPSLPVSRTAAQPSSAFSAAPSYTGPLHPSKPTFTHMDVSLTTRGQGKPASTRAQFLIVPDDGDTQDAYLDIQGRDLAAGSIVQELVPAQGESFTRSDLKSRKILLKVSGAGSSWKCSFDAILHFTDGSEALISSGDLTLSGSNAEVSLPLEEAMVAHATSVGQIERYMFGLMSKGGGPKETQDSAGETQWAHGNSKRFLGMEVSLECHSHGKPAGTRLEIFILPREGGDAVGYVDVQNRTIAPNSKFRIVVPAAGAGFTEQDLKNERVLVKISSPEPVTWTYAYDVVLHFDDGTQALLGSDDQKLTQAENQAFLSLSQASVASNTAIGALERFGFGILKR